MPAYPSLHLHPSSTSSSRASPHFSSFYACHIIYYVFFSCCWNVSLAKGNVFIYGKTSIDSRWPTLPKFNTDTDARPNPLQKRMTDGKTQLTLVSCTLIKAKLSLNRMGSHYAKLVPYRKWSCHDYRQKCQQFQQRLILFLEYLNKIASRLMCNYLLIPKDRSVKPNRNDCENSTRVNGNVYWYICKLTNVIRPTIA